MIFFVAANTIDSRSRYKTVLYALFISAMFQSLYGMYEFLSGNQQIFAYHKIHNLDCATGTFINRNHYAAYLGLSLPLLIAFVVGRISRLKKFGGKTMVRISHALEGEGSQVFLFLFAIVLLIVAVLFSLSRSGISFSILSSVLFLFLYWHQNHELTRKSYGILTAAIALSVSVWIGLRPLLERFERISDELTQSGARWQVWKDTFNIFFHFPFTGTGLGTFKEVFPIYRTFPTDLIYAYTHNDYLQILSETGLLSMILLLCFFFLLIRRIRILSHPSANRLPLIQIGAGCSLIALGLHNLTDFSIQIPAIAVTAAILCAVVFGSSDTEQERNVT
jgi:O-antigen ligase